PATGQRPVVGASANWIVSPVWVSRTASVGGLPSPPGARSASPIDPSASKTGEAASDAGPSTRSTRATTSGVAPGGAESRGAQAARAATARTRIVGIMAAGRSDRAAREAAPAIMLGWNAGRAQSRPARWRTHPDGRGRSGITVPPGATSGSAHGADQLDVGGAASEVDAAEDRAHGLADNRAVFLPDLADDARA